MATQRCLGILRSAVQEGRGSTAAGRPRKARSVFLPRNKSSDTVLVLLLDPKLDLVDLVFMILGTSVCKQHKQEAKPNSS